MENSSSLDQLEHHASDLEAAVKVLAEQLRGVGSYDGPGLASPPMLSQDICHARKGVLASLARLQTMLMGPDDLIQNLARQTQLLACVQWLAEFQVLACIPIGDTVLTRNIAELMGVPETQLSRIVRMASTAGFLAEPRPGYVAHTALSAPYVTRLDYLDATMFLAETAVPASLHMTAAMRTQGQGALSDEVPPQTYEPVPNTTPTTFWSACQKRPKLQRQWPAFLRCLGDGDSGATEVLSRLDWMSLGAATVVDLCAQSTRPAAELAALFPALHFVVQLLHAVPSAASTAVGPDVEAGGAQLERIAVQRRVPGTTQAVKDAAVYMFRTPSPPHSFAQDGTTTELILAELRAHLGILRGNAAAALVLVVRPLPDPGSVGVDIEAMACVRDLAKMQLTGEGEMQVEELVRLVNGVLDGVGRLAVVNKLLSPNSAMVALVVKYQFDS